jgi:hypothetical protein
LSGAGDALPEGVTARTVQTPRLATHVLESEPESAVPVVFVHGNVSSSLFFDETLAALPARYRGLAPDLRGFGGSETKPLGATRGMRDFSEDLQALVDTLDLFRDPRLAWRRRLPAPADGRPDPGRSRRLRRLRRRIPRRGHPRLREHPARRETGGAQAPPVWLSRRGGGRDVTHSGNLLPHGNAYPELAPGAYVIGDVHLGEQSSVWYGAEDPPRLLLHQVNRLQDRDRRVPGIFRQ